MLVTLISYADEASLYTIKNEAKKTSLILKNVKQGNLRSIKDAKEMFFYKEVIKESDIYAKGFD